MIGAIVKNYRLMLTYAFSLLSIFMLLFGLIILLFEVVSLTFKTEFIYPWWSVPFTVVYLAVSVFIFRISRKARRNLDRQRSAEIL
jgi:cbb3-type cytochrome oxidase subunit 3